MSFSPIALFVYNRPVHTRKTINALIKNIGAKYSDLYIFSDAPKTEKDSEAVNEVRNIIRNTKGFHCIKVIEKKTNQGLAKSIIEGVTMLCDKSGKVIVLEDDLITSKYFIKYMNKTLDQYEKINDVMHISAYMFPIESNCSESFFLPLTSSWGWGTWSRSWDFFETDGVRLYSELKEKNLFYEFNIKNSYDYKRMLKKQIEGKNDSWAIRWYASVFLNRGLGLFPGKSLVQNIGLDDSGVHCSATKDYDVILSDECNDNLPSEIKISDDKFDEIAQYYFRNKKTHVQKIIQKIKSIFL